MSGYETVLVPTDGSECARAAAEQAFDIAARFGATVHALYVVNAADLGLTTPTDVDVSEIRTSLRAQGEDATAELVTAAEEAEIPAVGTVRVGVPHETIVEYAAEVDADLVVMGTHGRTGFRRHVVGSVAERVVRTSPVPVLTVREP